VRSRGRLHLRSLSQLRLRNARFVPSLQKLIQELPFFTLDALDLFSHAKSAKEFGGKWFCVCIFDILHALSSDFSSFNGVLGDFFTSVRNITIQRPISMEKKTLAVASASFNRSSNKPSPY
jgi:hypothetical protein